MEVSSKKALLVGDLMLDHYTFGEVKRISPEAPVPIVTVKQEEVRPGGAGNVLLGLKALGIGVVALSRVGSDQAGEALVEALRDQGIESSAIVIDQSYKTPRKNRLIVQQQQLLRVDYEQVTPLGKKVQNEIIDRLPMLLSQADVVAISDYAKGFLTLPLLRSLITLANEREIPVIVDPKGRDFGKYKGVTLLKPNFAEAIDAAGLSMKATLDEIATKIRKLSGCENLLITRSEKGVSLFTGEVRQDFPASVREVKDVTGAGDTVLAVMTAALGAGLSFAEGARLANIAGGLAVEHVGCVPITMKEILQASLHAVLNERDLH
ncbi:MAG: HldE protein [Chlamydiia bacterium]|nr:HldE protein [Chlamydiia bacterium]